MLATELPRTLAVLVIGESILLSSDTLSGLMGIFEKRRFRNLLRYINELEVSNTSTWKGFDVNNQSMQVGGALSAE